MTEKEFRDKELLRGLVIKHNMPILCGGTGRYLKPCAHFLHYDDHLGLWMMNEHRRSKILNPKMRLGDMLLRLENLDGHFRRFERIKKQKDRDKRKEE